MIPFTGNNSGLIIRVTLAMLGKFAITSSFHVICLHASEIFPTTLRQIGVGSCTVAARIGAMIAPFVKELVCFWLNLYIFRKFYLFFPFYLVGIHTFRCHFSNIWWTFS